MNDLEIIVNIYQKEGGVMRKRKKKKVSTSCVPYSKVNHMKTRSTKQLLLGHSILHAWARDPSRTNWCKSAIIKEHAKLVKLMKQRGLEHNTPLVFSVKWKRRK